MHILIRISAGVRRLARNICPHGDHSIDRRLSEPERFVFVPEGWAQYAVFFLSILLLSDVDL